MRPAFDKINIAFPGGSNELGAFESGTLAALIGTVGSVVAGGIATLVVIALWMGFFPQLRRADTITPPA